MQAKRNLGSDFAERSKQTSCLLNTWKKSVTFISKLNVFSVIYSTISTNYLVGFFFSFFGCLSYITMLLAIFLRINQKLNGTTFAKMSI